MKLVIVCHSIRSCWNHGNAHFLRGIARAFAARGWHVTTVEPVEGWSLAHLRREHGETPVIDFHRAYPEIEARTYRTADDVLALVDGADLVLVHEWTPEDVVAVLAAQRRRGARYRLYFHDTHHRAVTSPETLATAHLDGFDGVLAFCASLAELYRARGWGHEAHVWHEAADMSRFHPGDSDTPNTDVVFVGNWGDDERSVELEDFLIAPCLEERARLTIHGVRYPVDVRARLSALGISYAGWLSNLDAPAALRGARATIHVPRRPYVEALPGAPTIRVFEALACGVPLLSAPWPDVEGLFRTDVDYLRAETPDAMRRALRAVLSDADMRDSLRTHGLATIRARHTCAHRVDELLAIAGLPREAEAA